MIRADTNAFAPPLHMRFVLARLAIVSALSWYPADQAFGQQTDATDEDSGAFVVGWLQTRIDFRLKGTRGSGSTFDVDAERDLGLPVNDDLPWLRAEYRLNDRWHLYGEYFDTKRRGTILRQSTVMIFGFLPLVVGMRYQTDLRITNYRLGARHAFFNGDRFDAGVNIGLDVLDAKVSARTTTLPLIKAESQEVVVPLPSLGFFGRYRLSDKGRLLAQVDGLPVRAGHYEANATHCFAAYEHNLEWGARAGIAYLRHDFHLQGDKPNRQRDAHYGYQGPLIYLSVDF
jgi:hypothetical protein